jgi:hypothetical protein
MQEQGEITTPGGKKVVLKGFLTGRMKKEIERIYLASAKVTSDSSGNLNEQIAFDASADVDAEYKAIELIVISVDGCPEGKALIDYILDDLPESDYDFIKAEVDKIQHPLVEKKEEG